MCNFCSYCKFATLFERFRGGQHTDERVYVFGEHPPFYGYSDYNMTAEEEYISDQMMSAWGNFIKTG